MAGDYKGTFWSKDKDGKWHQDGHKGNVKNIESCGFYARTAKSIVVEGSQVEDFIYKPIGQKVEIVPLSDVTNIKVNTPFKLQFFANAKPSKVAKVIGVIEGFSEGKYTFFGTTDLNGVIKVIVIKESNWMFHAVHEMPYADLQKCDKEELDASFIVEVKITFYPFLLIEFNSINLFLIYFKFELLKLYKACLIYNCNKNRGFMAYESFKIKDIRATKIAMNAKKFGVENLQNEAVVSAFLNAQKINLNNIERENIEKIFINLMKIEEDVQLSR